MSTRGPGKVGLTKKDANNVIDAITSAIRDSLESKEKVTWVGFGTFEVRRQKARRGVNPQTRQRSDIPEKNVVRFRAGERVKGESHIGDIKREM